MKRVPIQPGLLVCLSTRTEGGITYERHNETTRELAGGSKVTEWETVKTITDPEEFKRATEARSRVRALFRGVCCWTPFGLICPATEADRLEAAATEAEGVRVLFNSTSVSCKVEFSWLSGEIKESNEQAAKAIQQELAAVLGEMEAASKAGSVKEIRDATNRANQLARLLDQQSAAKTSASKAVKSARALARAIVKRVEKGGEELAAVIADEALAPIVRARFAFLGEEVEEDREPVEVLGVDPVRFAALGDGEDLDEEPTPEPFELTAEELAAQNPDGLLGDDLDEEEPTQEELDAYARRRATELGLVAPELEG